MVTLRPVVERTRPIGDDWHLVLGGHCTVDDVDVFMRAGTWASDGTTPAQLVAELLARDSLFAQGGLVTFDPATGVTVQPGCCAGLEGWTTWRWLLEGDLAPSLGHDPTPVVEEVGSAFRLWQDEDERNAYVDIPRAELPGLLDGVRRDLDSFTIPLREWAVANGLADRADDLVAAFRHSFTP
jgi:hypothetical protein